MKSRKIHTLVLTVLLCLVFLTTSIGNGQIIGSKQIRATGFVNAGSGIGKLIFSTDFEDVTWRILAVPSSGEGEGYLYIKDLNSQYYMYNYVHLTGYGNLTIDDGADYPNSPTPHSGSKMICTAIPAGSTCRRAELQFRFHTTGGSYPPTPWLTQQYFLRAWYYFSPDWALTDTNSYNWASLCTILNTAGMPWQFVLTVRPRTSSGYAPLDPVTGYKLCIGNVGEAHTGGPVETTPATWNVSSIRGRWNLVEIFVKNDPNGTNDNHCIIWWDGVKILEGYNFPTLNYQGSSWYVSIPKTYTDISSAANRQWFDDIELWDDIP